jgi:RNA polymerase sigma-70 factor (ECF subfamily)
LSQILLETAAQPPRAELLPQRSAGGLVSPLAERGARSREKGAGVGGEQPVAERARAGDPAAFDALFRAHASDVTRVCRRMLDSEATAQDAAQEVFLRARRGFASYDPERPFRSWLLGIAGHYCIDQLRRRSREARLFEAGDLDAADPSDPGASPLSRALAAERRSQVLEAIDALPLHYRLPLVLRYFHELDYGGIADILNLNRSQVGTLLFRAKRRLRLELSGGSP